MKKVLASTLALAMLLGTTTINAGAATSSGYFPTSESNNHFTDDTARNSGDTATGNASNEHAGIEATSVTGDTITSKDVTVKLTTGGTVSTTNVYAVTYDVTELTFTYSYGGTRIWNPETLEYEYDNSGVTGWNNNTTRTINITNYSDLAVKVTAAAGAVSANGVTLAVKETTGQTNELTLGSAYSAGSTNAATNGSFTVTVGGAPTGDYKGTEIAKITLTLSKVPAS